MSFNKEWAAVSFFERLKNIRRNFEAGDTPPEIIETLNNHVEYLLAEKPDRNAQQSGDVVSLDLEVYSCDGPTRLTKYLDQDFLVLTWFRGNW